jgi:tetratricopeptide (TPR) repeat protein
LSDYRQALKRDTRSAPARLALADELRAAHRVEEAAQEIAIYLEQNPDDSAGHLAAGRIAAEQGRFDEALWHLGKCLTIDPQNAPARRDMADLLARDGNLSESLAQLDRAEALDPFDISVCNTRAHVLARLGQSEKARAEEARASRLRAEQEDLASAQARLVSAPRDTEARLRVARWMFTHGKEPEGVRWAETILRDEPGQPAACQLLADYFERIGKAGLANFYRARSASSTGLVR